MQLDSEEQKKLLVQIIEKGVSVQGDFQSASRTIDALRDLLGCINSAQIGVKLKAVK